MSKEIVLTVIDVTGTQDYIFHSNRLRESIGASEIVAKATSWWVFQVLNSLFSGKTNLDLSKNSTNSISPFEAIQNKTIEDDGLEAEVIYVGGGNALILFDTDNNNQTANQNTREKLFTREFTKKLLREAPGLDVVIAHSSSFDIKNFSSTNDIRNKLEEVRETITVKKSCRPMSSKIEGLSVSTQCISTGETATHNPKDLATGEEKLETLTDKYGDNHISAEVFAKLQAVDSANARLRNSLFKTIEYTSDVKEKLGQDFAFTQLDVPLGFDNLGRTEGETSLIAVVHTDGNGMGKRIQEFIKKDVASNRDCIVKMRAMSKSIDNANLEALQKTTNFLASKLDKDKDGNVVIKDEDGKTFLLKKRWINRNGNQIEIICYPFRPVIFGGEDVAFVCDGRIALDLTAYYLKALESGKPLADGEPLYGRAGVAIVKSHYPFKRAYDLAEDLARSAKERIKDFEGTPLEKSISALDWHVAFTGLAGDISEIRKREYKVEQGNLNMRPLSLGKRKNNSDWRTWENFVLIIREFQTGWEESRNKAKALREALRGGENRVEQFRKLFDKTLPKFEVNELSDFQKKGWHEGICAYFDALEMMDLYFWLNNKASTNGKAKTDESEDKTNE